MQMKYILLLASLCASAYSAAVKDDCKELGALLNNSMKECKMNEKGEMIELEYNTFDESVKEEAYKKALSYQTLKKLTFKDEYSNCNQLTFGLTNLKNLEELNIRSFRGKLAPNTLKGLTSLKKFSYDTGDSNMGSLSKENLEELGTLTNLESLEFSFTGLNLEGLTALQNLNKVTSLTLDCNGKSGMNIEGCLANLKNLKELYITYDIKNQEEADAIASYTNLEKLEVGFRDHKIKCDNMKNLTKLKTLVFSIDDDDKNEVPSCVNSIPNLNKLTYNGKLIFDKGNENDNVDLNSGNSNSGNSNSGNSNSGNSNSGDLNSGNSNSGDLNSNNTNSDNLNTGNPNSGNLNTGNPNSGNLNTGNSNSGDLNSGDLNSGAGSTLVHAISYLPAIAIALRMLL